MNSKGLCVLILFIIISNITFYYYYYEKWTNPQLKIHLIINIHTKGKYKEYV